MNYRVVFRERGNKKGDAGENPIGFLQGGSENVVRRSSFIRRTDPEVKTVADPLEGDDEFLSLGTEVWEYEVAEGKDQEFKDALLNSGSIIEFTLIGAGQRE